ncbi:MAG: AAA-like domain-containing protein [Pseudomonadota bacterium]
MRDPAGSRQQIFISYRRSAPDCDLAGFLKAGLEAAGFAVFVDIDIALGANWATEIDHRIAQCDYFVVLISEESVQSEMVQSEVRRAHRRRSRQNRPQILPIRIQFDGPLDYELDYYLASAQYSMWWSEADSETVLQRILKTVSSSPVEPAAEDAGADADLSSPVSTRPAPAPDPRLLQAPGGSLSASDKFYIRRLADARIEATAARSGETIVIRGPRQVGKSSLLIQYLQACANAGRRIVFFDLQVLTDQQVDDCSALLTSIAHTVSRRLGVRPDPKLRLHEPIQLTNFIDDRLLPQVDGPVVLAFDEVDRLLGRPYQSDFFSMLRYWHNKRAEPMSLWDTLDIALVISTEPYLLIDSADRSPFNVAVPIELSGFSRAEVGEMNDRHDGFLSSDEVDQLFELLRGHPYLTRLAYFRMLVDPKMSFEELDDRAAESTGPFSDHLRAKLFWIGRNPDLLKAMRLIALRRRHEDDDSFVRLRAAGLVTRDGGQVSPANMLYARFFKSVG